MLSEGTAKATKFINGVESTVKSYSSGGYFGERALLLNDVRAANVVATSNVICLCLDRETFKRLLGPLDLILRRNMDEYKKFI
jgi:cAMP-dependent protein kinase regulator